MTEVIIEPGTYAKLEEQAHKKRMSPNTYASELLEKAKKESEEQEKREYGSIETVEVALKFKFPKQCYDFMKILSPEETPEEMMIEELYAVFYNFYEGGFWDNYMTAIGKRFDKLVMTVANQDC
jgi:hypothetical protein